MNQLAQRLFSKSGLSYERLKTFCEVAATGGISVAVPGDPTRQSQFSRQIKELEAFFETELFRRKRGRFELTPSGRELFQIVQSHFSALQELANRCAHQQVEIRIGAGESLLQWLMLPCLRDFRARHRTITLVLENLQTEQIVRKLMDGQLDIGLLRQEAVHAPLKCERLGQLEHMLVFPRQSPETIRKKDLWTRLAGHPVAVLEGSEVTSALERDATKRKIALDVCLRGSSYSQLVEAVKSFSCAAVIPNLVTKSLGQNTVGFPLPALKPYSRTLVLAWNPKHCALRPTTLSSIQYLVGQLKLRLQVAG